MNIPNSKAALRQMICTAVKNLSPEKRASDSTRACSLFARQEKWKNARSILLFAPLPDELDIWALVSDSLAAGKAGALPRFDFATRRYIACQINNLLTDIKPGKFGIREPAAHCAVIPLNRLDLILVPGVAFDLHGRRLGRGKGFYDQLLAGVRGTTCGVGFDEQIVAEIPIEPHDIHLNCILTPTRWIKP